MDITDIDKTLKKIDLLNIIDYFNFEILEKTNFYYSYKKNNHTFLMFLNSNDDNKLSIYSINNLKYLTKLDLFLMFSNIDKDLSNLSESENINKELPSVPTSIEKLTKYWFSLTHINKELYNVELLPDSLHAYSYKDQLVIPTFDKEDSFSNLIYANANTFNAITERPGFINTNVPSTTDELHFTIVFNPYSLYLYLLNNVSTKNQFYILNEYFDYQIFDKITKEIYDNSYLSFHINILYQNTLKEKELLLKFLSYYVSKFTDHTLSFSKHNDTHELSLYYNGKQSDLLRFNSTMTNAVYDHIPGNVGEDFKDYYHKLMAKYKILSKPIKKNNGFLNLIEFPSTYIKLFNLNTITSFLDLDINLIVLDQSTIKQETEIKENANKEEQEYL